MADKPNLSTPDAGDLNTAARRICAERGWAMPDGSYPIRPLDNHGRTDLGKAIGAVGRGGGSHDAIRRHIIKRARSLGLSDQIPDNWSSGGAMERSERSIGASVPADVPIAYRSALPIEAGAVNFTERTIDMVAVPYGQQSKNPVLGPDGRMRPEVIKAGAFDAIENFRNDNGTFDLDITVNRDHKHERAVGKIIDYQLGDPSGLPVQAYVSETPLGDETLQLAHDGVLKGSVGYLARRSDQYVDRRGVRWIRRGFLDHLALVPNPAWQGAKVVAVRSEGSDSPVEIREVSPDDEAAWEAAARIEAMASRLRR